MNLLSELLNIAFRCIAGFIPRGGAKVKVILLFVTVVVTLGWIFSLTFLLSYVLANSFLRFSMRDNLRQLCRRCNSPDHLAKDCNNTFCFNCDSIGHVSKRCPANVKCCICKEESHKAIDCQLSWPSGLPSQRSPDPEPAAVSVVPVVVNPSGDEDNETDLSSVMDFQRQEDAWHFKHPQ